LTSIEAVMPELPDLNSPEFAPIKARLVRAYLEHKADIGAPDATDQDILDNVDDITALMLGALGRAMAERRHTWLQHYGWFTDLVIELLEDEPKRQGHQVARYIRADWLGQVPHQTKTWQGLRPVWKIEWKDSKDAIFRDRPAALITREDILARLNTIRRARGSNAPRHALDAVRRVFGFAANHGHAGIKGSPAASLRDKSVELTGAMMRRQRC
jgi:hypothetical protein